MVNIDFFIESEIKILSLELKCTFTYINNFDSHQIIHACNLKKPRSR